MTQIDNFPSSRKYRMSPEDVLRLNSIEVLAASRYYTTCPQCSAKRKPIHQQLKCLGVTRPDPDRVFWGCNHCGWTGPGRPHTDRRINLPRPKLRPSAPEKRPNHPPTTTRTLYNYGEKLRKVKVVRPDGEKLFWWEHLKVKGSIWDKGPGPFDTQSLLYRIAVAKQMARLYHLPICIVEGEKDAECLLHHGFPATCNAHGASEPGRASKWYESHSLQLKDWGIAVFNDDDPQGVAHRDAILALSKGICRAICVVDQRTHFPGCHDIADWFRAGGDAATLRDFIEGAPVYGA
jgi:hypothetical protein